MFITSYYMEVIPKFQLFLSDFQIPKSGKLLNRNFC